MRKNERRAFYGALLPGASAVALMAALFISTSAGADLIKLKDGKTIEAEIISSNEESITLKLPIEGGSDIVYTIDAGTVGSIEKRPLSYAGIDKESGREKKGFHFLDRIIEKINKLFGRGGNVHSNSFPDPEKYIARIRLYISSSFIMGLVADFLLALLVISGFGLARKARSSLGDLIKKTSPLSVAGRWLFMAFSVMFVHVQRFASFDIISGGGASAALAAVLAYETLGCITLLFLKDKYVSFVKGENKAAGVILKLPVAAETLVFFYFLVMDIMILFM